MLNLDKHHLSYLSITSFLYMVSILNVFADSADHGSHTYQGSDGTHSHEKWIAPPTTYKDKVSTKWNDKESAKRGQNLYKQYCLQCHGADGKGTGPLASSLEHAPADLTNHFHQAPGKGDAYLYWRVSEGGRVEPFVSMKSNMPSFKMILSEQARWDVLIYIHQTFHKSFTTGRDEDANHRHDEHQH